MSRSNTSDASEGKIFHFSDRSLRRLLSDPWSVSDLLRLIAPDFVRSLDFSRATQESRTFVSEVLREREADVLLRVPFQETSESEELLICILVEHQSSVDSLMGLRVLTYMVEIWQRELRAWESGVRRQRRFSPILPIVLYTGADRWTAPLSLAEVLEIPEAFARFVPTFDTLLLDVKASERDTFTQLGSLFGWLLSVLREAPDDKAGFRDALAAAVPEINRSPDAQQTQIREAIRYLILLILHQCSEEEHTALIDLVDQYSSDDMEVIHMAQTAADALREQGTRESLIEGILENLEVRFELRDLQPVKARLQTIETSQQLRKLRRAALQVPSFEAFRQTLDSNPNS